MGGSIFEPTKTRARCWAGPSAQQSIRTTCVPCTAMTDAAHKNVSFRIMRAGDCAVRVARKGDRTTPYSEMCSQLARTGATHSSSHKKVKQTARFNTWRLNISRTKKPGNWSHPHSNEAKAADNTLIAF